MWIWLLWFVCVINVWWGFGLLMVFGLWICEGCDVWLKAIYEPIAFHLTLFISSCHKSLLDSEVQKSFSLWKYRSLWFSHVSIAVRNLVKVWFFLHTVSALLMISFVWSKLTFCSIRFWMWITKLFIFWYSPSGFWVYIIACIVVCDCFLVWVFDFVLSLQCIETPTVSRFNFVMLHLLYVKRSVTMSI